jgi:hypothetical protein
MQCAELRECLARGEIPTGADEHLLVCESCAALVVRHLAKQDTPALQLERMFGELEARIEKERGVASWLRSQPTRIRWLLANGAGLALVLLAAGVAARADLANLPIEHKIAVALYALASMIVAGEMLRPMHKHQRPALSLALAVGALISPVVIAVSFSGAESMPPVAARGGCLLLGLLVAWPLLLLLRRLDRASPGARGSPLLAIGAASLVANLALVLCCPSNNPAHLLRAHAPVGLALCLGYLGMRRLVRSTVEA